MRIHNIYITLSASLLAFTGCSNETDIVNSNAGKHAIELSVGADAPQTRAVITDGTDKTLNAFNSATDIWMVMQSDYVALSGDNENPSDIDFKGSQTTTNCITMGTTGDKTSAGNENVVNFTTENTRYWDDAHARSSRLSIWAVTVPNVTGNASKWIGKTTKSWTTATEVKTIAWEIPAAQTTASVKEKDLCFSNNIVDYSSAAGSDKRLKYGVSPSPAFEAGKLIFYHALSKITIILKEGKGFNTSSTSDFNLNNITLNGFKLSGTFDVAQGEFSSTGEVTPITSMSQVEKTASQMTLEALVMPGTDLNSSLADAVSFSLDRNAFKVSAATLKDKLPAGFNKFEAGNNYVFTFTINKTDIEVTATIADWNTVTGQNYAPKINITEVYGQEKTEANNFGKDFTFYRSLNQSSDYVKGSDVTYNEEDKTYSFITPLYWPDHETHYFFRGVWPKVAAGTPEAKVSASAIQVTNVPYSAETYPSILMLGYPRKADGSSDETCKVHTTTQGICATEGEIRMNFQYVMSQVEVNLATVEGASKVIFDEHTQVEIIGGYTAGAILFSNGSASFDGKTPANYTMNREGTSNIKYHDAIIPQSLGEGLTGLKFRITVTDIDGKQDKYETVLGIADIDMGGGSKISSWEPGKRYVYTLTITKTGIKVVATIKDWEEATGSTDIWF